MDEYIDILDSSGKPTGETALKSVAHQKGLFHPTIHVWFYTKNGKLLIQKRAFTKDTFPGLWDVSVAGHIGAGEEIVQSAIREVKEEIGLNIEETNLTKIGVYKNIHKHKDNLTDCEFNHIFIAELKTPLQKLKIQESEVEEIKLISLAKYKKYLLDSEACKAYVKQEDSYYTLLFGSIEKQL
ncbi:NUDIX hydrolase [Abyssalbus ytuae]|uniref:NUDIX domain-containing protein n=1 Tax=Abyssalbus ytuae TaxID=2926907 RepID=A0A9E6ZK81_9FLAO|nr:NUDIX domain-containing protein [Abyssalbus ytuae]UOB17192.1 NUDIX domain-containing protein [Abyssalbus ytuae]